MPDLGAVVEDCDADRDRLPESSIHRADERSLSSEPSSARAFKPRLGGTAIAAWNARASAAFSGGCSSRNSGPFIAPWATESVVTVEKA